MKLEIALQNELQKILIQSSTTLTNRELIEKLNLKFSGYENLKLNSILIRKLINRLRQLNVPILANSNGYWVSYDREEISIYLLSLDSRLESIKRAQSGIRACLNTINMFEVKMK